MGMLGDTFGAVGDYYGAKRQAKGMKSAIDGYNTELGNTRDRMSEMAGENLGGAYDDINSMYGGYRGAGQQGLNQLGNRDQYRTNAGEFQFDGSVEDYLDPSMDFQIEQAMRGVNSGAGASNQAMSGKTMKALSDRSSAIAQQNYGDAFNRMRGDRGDAYQQFSDDFNRRRASNQDMYSQDQNMANMGMNATGQTANARQQLGSGMVNALSPSYGTSNQSKAGIHDMVMGGAYGNMGRSVGNLMESGAQAYDTGGLKGLGKSFVGIE
jgi:methyl-accepting chemotaxis protein